jgi:hypothetical protein
LLTINNDVLVSILLVRERRKKKDFHGFKKITSYFFRYLSLFMLQFRMQKGFQICRIYTSTGATGYYLSTYQKKKKKGATGY